MDKAELRAKFNREISAPDKELLWEELEQDHYVSEVCQGESTWAEFEARASLVAERQRKLFGRTKPPGRSPSFRRYYVDVRPTDLEAEHATALAPYLAKQAALLPEVCVFREEKLGGGILETKQVASFLRSELGHLPQEEYADMEWALQQVPSLLDRDEEEELKDLVGGSMNRGSEADARYWSENFRRAVEFDSMSMDYVPSQQFLHGLMHLICDDSGRTLEELGLWLVSRYPWPLRDAAWFVLTGEPPEVEALEIGFHPARGTFSINFARWISEKTIIRAYRSVYDSDNRPLGDKSLSAFRFVYERTEPGRTPKWAELTEQWNKRHPNDKFTDRSALRRTYKRAEKQLASPWLKEQGHEMNSNF